MVTPGPLLARTPSFHAQPERDRAQEVPRASPPLGKPAAVMDHARAKG